MPINLAGGGRAGGVGDALLEIVKQRLLEQELNQRQQDQELSRRRQDRLDARQVEQDTYNRGRDTAADAVAKEGRDRQAKIDAVNIGKAQLSELNDRPFSELVDPQTQGFGPKATPAVGLPPMPGTNVGGVSPPEVRQGQVRAVDIGGVAVKPRTMEDRDKAAAIDEQRKEQSQIRVAEASKTPPRPAQLQHVDGGSFNPETGEYTKASGWTPEKSGPTLTPGDALSATLRLRTDFRRETTAAQTAVKQYQLMESALKSVKEGRSAAGSQGVLVTFQKILDPTSVVRESEYARSAAGQALLSRLEGSWDRIVKGGAGVPVSELENFVTTAKGFAQKQADYAKTTKDQIDHIAKKYGLEPADITRDLVTELGGGDDQNVQPAASGGVTVTRDAKGNLVVKR